MTFCVTWVVESTLWTHDLNSGVGIARAFRLGTGSEGDEDTSFSAKWWTGQGSNQKKVVI